MEVVAVMDGICDYDNFMNFEYSPMEMVEACEVFIEGYDQKFETFLTKRKTEDIDILTK